MTNRIELNWDIPYEVDEQRYYCSETPIDPANLPAPKAVLTGDARSHIDTFVTLSSVYNIAISSVKNNAEKLSEVKRVQAGDGDWSSVISLLYFNANFIDETGRIWVNTNVAVSSESPIVGVKSGVFSGNAQLGSTNDVSVGSGDFTVEMFSKGIGSLFSKRIPTGTSNAGFTLFVSNTNKLSVWNGYQEISSNSAIDVNAFTHKAFVKHGNRLKIFNHGVMVYDDVYSISDNSYPIQLGAAMYNGVAVDFFNGLIAMPRITKTARYTGNFTPPDFVFSNA